MKARKTNEAAIAQVLKVSLDMTRADKEAMIFRSIRNDPLGEMRAKRIIDDVQFMAGRAWQARYEKSWPKAEDEGEIKRVGGVLGRVGSSMLQKVLAEGMSLADVAKRDGRNRSAKEGWNAVFAKYLDIVAIEFGRCDMVAA